MKNIAERKEVLLNIVPSSGLLRLSYQIKGNLSLEFCAKYQMPVRVPE